MKKFLELMERYIVPIAAKIGGQRHLVAVRDAFVGMIAITMAGAFAVLFNNLGGAIPGYDKFWIGIFGEGWKTLGGNIWWATFAFMALFIIIGIAHKLAKSYGDEGFEVMFIALACFLILIPQMANVSLTPEGAKTAIEGKNWGLISWSYVNQTALFTAIIVSLISTEIFVRLARVKYLVIKLPESVPPAVSRAFAKLLPGMLTIFAFGTFAVLFDMATKMAFNDWISKLLVSPLTNAADSLGFALIIVLLQQVFWSVGLHGSNILLGIQAPLMTKLAADNLALFQAHATTGYAIFAGNFLDAYVWLGGSGATIGLLIAIAIASKERRQLLKIAGGPALFEINEPVIFGLPIVLNPIFIIPFILAPVVMTIVAYLATASGLVAPCVATMPWVMPPVIGAWIATGGHLSGAILAAVNLVISIVIYFPFLIAADKIDRKNLKIVVGEKGIGQSL
jgi:PTS system cellobiose-specific IIC component